jgi:enoyl-CoA hydratase
MRRRNFKPVVEFIRIERARPVQFAPQNAKEIPMSDENVVIYQTRGPVAEITLNRPKFYNAINPEMACRLIDAFNDFDRNPDLRVAIVTGAGKAFSAGGDLRKSLPLLTGARQPEDQWDDKVVNDMSIMARSVRRDMEFNKPVIAAVNGACLAGGAELLVSTDIRIACDHATFGLPEVRHGLIPFAGALVRLTQQISYCNAMQILLTGEPLSAKDAWRIGLINEVVPEMDVLPRARTIAASIARNGPLAVRKVKQTVLQSIGARLNEAFAMEDAARNEIMASKDAIEGPEAFVARREPAFTGF